MCVRRREEGGGEREDCPPNWVIKYVSRDGVFTPRNWLFQVEWGAVCQAVAAGSSAAEGRGWFPVSYAGAGTHCSGRLCVHRTQEWRQGLVAWGGPGSHGHLPASQVSLTCLCTPCPLLQLVL